MTLGQLLAFAAFVGYLYPPIQSLGQLGLTVTEATAGAERLLEIVDAPPAVTDPDPSVIVPTPERAVGAVEACRVGFHYPGSEQEVLHDFSFTAVPGELVVITGPSGAGKSTLAALLLRFYDPDTGSVRLDGIPVNRMPLAQLRRNITLLPQDTLVLHDTVEENIACGRDDVTHDDVVQAARAADAEVFIAALPDGYDTVIAPGTSRLSGGQLQRVAIARAMLRNAPVLILDEPTTGLDTLATQRILAPLRRPRRGPYHSRDHTRSGPRHGRRPHPGAGRGTPGGVGPAHRTSCPAGSVRHPLPRPPAAPQRLRAPPRRPVGQSLAVAR